MKMKEGVGILKGLAAPPDQEGGQEGSGYEATPASLLGASLKMSGEE